MYMHQLITCINYTQNDCSFIVSGIRLPKLPRLNCVELLGEVETFQHALRDRAYWVCGPEIAISRKHRENPVMAKSLSKLSELWIKILNLKNWNNDQWKMTMYLYIYICILCIRWIIQGFWRSLEDWDLFNICMTIVGKLPNKNSTRPQLSPQKPSTSDSGNPDHQDEGETAWAWYVWVRSCVCVCFFLGRFQVILPMLQVLESFRSRWRNLVLWVLWQFFFLPLPNLGRVDSCIWFKAVFIYFPLLLGRTRFQSFSARWRLL